MKMKRAFVLLSGGIDSTTCLHKAIVDYAPPYADLVFTPENFVTPYDWVEAISIDYGQRHIREAAFAHDTCSVLRIKHTILKIGDILSGTDTMLTNPDVKIPDISYSEIKGVSPTYVPFRNGTLLSIITAYAQKWVNEQIAANAKDLSENNASHEARHLTDPDAKRWATDKMKDSVGIYFGAHAEDAQNWAYPDCTPEFIGAMANAIYIGSYMCIRLHTPLEWLDKADVIELGEGLGVNWKNTWSCYAGGELHCGVCPTCRARREGFVAAGVLDPTEYAA